MRFYTQKISETKKIYSTSFPDWKAILVSSLSTPLSIQSSTKILSKEIFAAELLFLLPRVVPITPEVKYQGIVHEAPISLTREHLMLVTEIQIIHLGADPKLEKGS